MDDIVKQAMAKWPNVPDCYGWLGLEWPRGQRFMRDDAAQAAGAGQACRPGARGSRLQHEKLIAFIERNYAADAGGRWFFQNIHSGCSWSWRPHPCLWPTMEW